MGVRGPATIMNVRRLGNQFQIGREWGEWTCFKLERSEVISANLEENGVRGPALIVKVMRLGDQLQL